MNTIDDDDDDDTDVYEDYVESVGVARIINNKIEFGSIIIVGSSEITAGQDSYESPLMDIDNKVMLESA